MPAVYRENAFGKAQRWQQKGARPGGEIPVSDSSLEKLKTQATSSKFQTPNSKEAPSSKPKNRRAGRWFRLCFWCLRFGTSLELEVLGLGVSPSGG